MPTGPDCHARHDSFYHIHTHCQVLLWRRERGSQTTAQQERKQLRNNFFISFRCFIYFATFSSPVKSSRFHIILSPLSLDLCSVCPYFEPLSRLVVCTSASLPSLLCRLTRVQLYIQQATSALAFNRSITAPSPNRGSARNRSIRT